MRYPSIAALLAFCVQPALADVEQAIGDHVQPSVARFAEATGMLAEIAQKECRVEAVRPAYQDVFDAWMGISHLQFGPLEEGGRSYAIAFWPDTRGMVDRTVAGLIADGDAAVGDPDAFAEVSVAGRGLFALERLLYEPALSGYDRADYVCRLVTAIAVDLAATGAVLDADWTDYAEVMRAAGSDGNEVFLRAREPAQVLYTALLGGLEFTADQRLGRPMGTFERPRPTRAEARRSERSLRNVVLSLDALQGLARTLSNAPIPAVDAAFAKALETAAALDDPVFAGVDTPTGRLKVEVLQQQVRQVRDAVAGEIGVQLGLGAGFNSQDGD